MSDDDASEAESPPRCVDSYYRPGNFEDPLHIIYPVAANGVVSNFKIQPNLIAILPVFRGHEEPYAHLREFFSIADTYQVNNTTKDGKISAFIDSRLKSIERFLNRFAEQPNETSINDPKSDDESVDTPLVSPFLHSNNDSDDEEEAWETIENFAQGQKEWDNPPNIISNMK
ncbi:hypothetical protein Tco_0207068 [Tanacetum coccineum]